MMFIASSLDGGAEKVVAELSNTLVAIGENVVVAAFAGSRWLRRLDPGVKVYELTSSEEWYDPRLYWQLRQLVKQEQPDLVHSHGAKASKIISRVAQLVPLIQVATKHNSRKGKVFNRLQHVTAVSGKVAESISHPVEVIYNGVPRQQGLVPKIPEGTLSLLAVGRLDPIKRFNWLIKEVAALKGQCTLELVGDGPQRTELEALVASLDAEDYIHLVGEQTDVPERMTRSHAVVIASRSEGFSLVMVEALFYANLFLSTKVGAAPELLPDELLIAEGELKGKLEQLSQDYDGMVARFRSLSQQQAGQFEMVQVARQYMNFYRRVSRAPQGV